MRLRETSPGVVRMDHDEGQHDDRAIALALAASKLSERGAPGKGSIEVRWDPYPLQTPGGVGDSGTFGYGDSF